MKYREKIQNMVEQINKLYNDAEWLRDFATSEEKEHWNAHRKIFYDAALPLKRLDNSLSNKRAESCLCDDPQIELKNCYCDNCSTSTRVKKMTCPDCKDVWYRGDYCDNCGEKLNI